MMNDRGLLPEAQPLNRRIYSALRSGVGFVLMGLSFILELLVLPLIFAVVATLLVLLTGDHSMAHYFTQDVKVVAAFFVMFMIGFSVFFVGFRVLAAIVQAFR